MVDVTYGSIDVIKLVLLCPEANVNFAFTMNKSTALNFVVYGVFVGSWGEPRGSSSLGQEQQYKCVGHHILTQNLRALGL